MKSTKEKAVLLFGIIASAMILEEEEVHQVRRPTTLHEHAPPKPVDNSLRALKIRNNTI